MIVEAPPGYLRFKPLEPTHPEENMTVSSTTNAIKGHQTLLLQTAQVVAFRESEQPHLPIQLLFDSGSQPS